jgi:hypothetical protein
VSWYREKAVKAVRKPHDCAGCPQRINIGEPALYVACLAYGSDGPFYGHYHHDCRAAECALNTLHACYAGDDWLPLYEIEADDHDWLRAKYPAVASRLLARPSDTGDRRVEAGA